jgi:hypothetical protein
MPIGNTVCTGTGKDLMLSKPRKATEEEQNSTGLKQTPSRPNGRPIIFISLRGSNRSKLLKEV